MSDLRIEIVPHNSEAYQESVKLRDRILREPLGLEFSDEELAAEDVQTHVTASVDGVMIGVMILVPLDKRTFKMRQVAVDTNWQGKGIGTRLVSFAEEYAIKMGVCCIRLHARKEALKFYQELAYTQLGDEFTEIGIPHYLLEKNWCSDRKQ